MKNIKENKRFFKKTLGDQKNTVEYLYQEMPIVLSDLRM